ncbi:MULTISPECIES: hypothetical protein [unclassified Legionella]|uniref:hypothetical protein n=1 Tax=unclassified Legionella TaxID=2622702 RepID=UPI001056DFEA|nr:MULTISPECIES: hypothetical protein [unclassified Legionella]MDI9818341.1 hypothetical protein [Legionella sp. PL877]
MPFVLSNEFIARLRALRLNYEKQSGINFDTASQPYAIRCFFGAKDVDSRNKQITFIEQWLNALHQELASEDFFSSETTQAYVTALRLLMVVCFYTKFQIAATYKVRSGNSAILEQLIHEAMGVNGVNLVDEETHACCLRTAKRYLTAEGRFEAINANLTPPFKEQWWHDFLNYIDTQCNLLDKKYVNDYPITKIMMPLFAKPMEFAGYTTGFLLGDMIGKSTKLFSTRYVLTAAIGSGLLLVMGPTASIGITVLAPTCAGRILDTFCGVSLAWLFGAAGNIVGQGLGFGVGMPIDMSWKLIYKTATLLASLYSNHRYPHKLNGLSLIDGHRIIDSVEFELMDMETLNDKLSLGYSACKIKFKVSEKELTVIANNQQETFSWDKNEQPYMEELKNLFATQELEKTRMKALQAEEQSFSGTLSRAPN